MHHIHRCGPLLLVLLVGFARSISIAQGPGAWCPDNGDGTYKNPILFADYSDPDVIRVGDDFYLTASSFSCFPGLPILHSRDLVNWTIIGHAIDKYPIVRFKTPVHGCGVWAPAIRFHDGQFYIFFGDPDYGIFMAKAPNPAGPWDPLVRVKDSKGWIDTCPFWDDDGKVYLVHAFSGSRAGISNVLDINRMSPDGTQLLDQGTRVFDGKDGNYTTLEGPKLYKRNGYYYIMAPGGGVGGGYQIVLRSKNIYGPYDSHVVLRQGKTNINGPHQGGWVQTQTGQSWFIHFQQYLPYGRVVHLQPVQWVDDWPIMGDAGEPVMSHPKPDVGKNWPIAVPQTSDEFNQPTLGLQWQWWADFQDDWISLTERPGFLRMKAVATPAVLFDRPNLLLQKFPAEAFTVTARLELAKLEDGDRAGLVVAGLSTGALQVEKDPAGLKIIRTTFIAHRPTHWRGDPLPGSDDENESRTIPGQSVFLRVKVNPGGNCVFSYSPDNERFTEIGPAFTAANDLWIGAKVGLFCNAPVGKSSKGFADVDWFRFGN
ncbi:MAG: glycoside hydrolase 43 family protein [Tepidisphaeraceae bacterium]